MNTWQTLYRVFQIGDRLICDKLDEDELTSIGFQLVELSGICHVCQGSGHDREMPDAACVACEGTGNIQPNEGTME